MPLDILPAPAVAPGGAAPDMLAGPAPAAPPGLGGVPSAPGGALALFGLLLAQALPTPTVAAPLGAAKSAALPASVPAPAPTGAKTQATAHADKSKDDAKDRPLTAEAAWAPPVLSAPLAPPVPPAVTMTAAKTTPGTVMDTASPVSGESLSPTQTQWTTPQATAQVPVATEGNVPADPAAQADVIVPAEAGGPDTQSAAAFTPLVPTIAAQASQAVILPAPAATPPGPAASPTVARPAPHTATPGQAAPVSHAPTSAVTPGPGASPVPAAAAPQETTITPAEAATAPQVTVSAPQALQNGGAPADNQTGKIAEAPPVTAAVVPPTVAPTSGRPRPEPVTPAAPRKAGTSEKNSGAAAGVTSSSVPAARADQSAVPAAPATVAAPPAATAAPMPAPDRERMVRQVADGVGALAAQPAGPRQVTVQLHPRDWGKLNVSVTLTPTTGADGKVATQVVAHVVAESQSVKAALETHRSDLRQALQGTGLHLDTLTVTVQAPTGGAQAGMSNDRQPGANADGGWAGQQSPAGQSPAGGAPFGGGQQSAADFAQGDSSSRRPPTPYAAAQAHTSSVGDDLAVVAADRGARTVSGRVDTRA